MIERTDLVRVIRGTDHECNAWCKSPRHCDRVVTGGFTQEQLVAAYTHHLASNGCVLVSLEPAYEAGEPVVYADGDVKVKGDAVWLLTWEEKS